MARKFKLTDTSVSKLNKFCESLKSDSQELLDKFSKKFIDIVFNDVKLIKECSETSIVQFYIECCGNLLSEDYTIENSISNKDFWELLKSRARHKLVNKYVSNKSFDNNIDIYFNEVKKEYILHPQSESEDLEFIPENKDIFIKNNLKLVIECAKRYQNLGLPFEDLIQAGNIGLLTAFEKFDTERANLRFDIIKSIENHESEVFTYDDACDIIRKNFSYTKLLDQTLLKIPQEGFNSKEDFIEWAKENIKKATFSSISFAWIRANIITELNNYSKIVKVPKSTKSEEENPINIIRLDSINPHTDDCYHDNQTSEVTTNEFILEDESLENNERQQIFKDVLNHAFSKLSGQDRRIIKKRFGIEFPFPMSINEISESEGINPNKVKYSIKQSLKIITNNIPELDKKTLAEMLS